jgi:hypothetical protein
MRSLQAAINTHIVIGVAMALLLKYNRMLLSDLGGPITLEREWARKVRNLKG